MTPHETNASNQAYLCLQHVRSVQKAVSDSDLENLSSVLSAFDDGLLLGHLVRSGRWMWLDNGVLIRRRGAK